MTLGSNMGGTAPMTYQWYLSGAIIPGATGSSITVTNMQTTKEGTYSVAVTNAAGHIVQNIAIVKVNDPAVITQQPVSTNSAAGLPVTLSVAATGRSPLTYQWFKEIPAARYLGLLQHLHDPSCSDSDTDKYYVSVLNSDGSAYSPYVYITVIRPATVSLQPRNVRVAFGKTTNMFATFNSLAPVMMQWYKDGFTIPGATNDYCTVANAAMKDEGDYVVHVQNSVGGTNSVAAHPYCHLPTRHPVEPPEPDG